MSSRPGRASAKQAGDGRLIPTREILRRVNLRHLGEHRRRALLAVLGLAAGVGLLISIGVINATLSNSITAETRGLGGAATFQAIPAGVSPLTDASTLAVRATPGVSATAPVLTTVSGVRHGSVSTRMTIFGVSRDLARLFPDDPGLGLHISRIERGSGSLIATTRLANALGVRSGDELSVETPHGYVSLRVISTLSHSPFEAVNGGMFAIMALPEAQRIFDRQREVSGIFVAARAGVSKHGLQAALERSLGPGAAVVAPGSEGLAYKRTFESIASISGDARLLGLFVAFFLVLNTMSMSLSERREEIALLAVIGARRGQIFAAFLVEAAILGAIGSIVGIVLGTLVAHLLIQRVVDSYNVLPITAGGPLVLAPAEVLLGLVGGTCVAVLGALLPARRILGVAPINALRPEAVYEWNAQDTRRPSMVWGLAGVAAVAASAAIAALLPIGSSVTYAGLSLTLALLGAVLMLPLLVPLVGALSRRVIGAAFGPVGKLASDAMFRAPGRTIITAGGVAMAAALSIAIGASVNSYRNAGDEAAAVWYGAPLYVNPKGSAAYIPYQPLRASFRRILENVPGVEGAFPMTYGVINSEGRQTIIYAMPVIESEIDHVNVIGNLGISQVALQKTLERGEIVISRLTARHRHLTVGDRISLAGPHRVYHLRIGGLFDDISSLDSICMDHVSYERFTKDTRVDRFAIVPAVGSDVAAVKRKVQHALDEHGVPATVLTRRQMANYLISSIQSLFSVAQATQVAALLVAALMMLSTMLAAIFERRREFGIARAVGMNRRQLGGSVILEASGVSLVGAVIAVGTGLGLGFLITLSIENELAWRIAFKPSMTLTLEVVALTVLVSILAALYPSWIAARQKIVTLLRFE